MVEIVKIDTPYTQIHDHLLVCLTTSSVTSTTKSDGVKLVLWAQIAQ